MKIYCHVKDVYKICMEIPSVWKRSEGPQLLPNIYTHMQAFVLKAM